MKDDINLAINVERSGEQSKFQFEAATKFDSALWNSPVSESGVQGQAFLKAADKSRCKALSVVTWYLAFQWKFQDDPTNIQQLDLSFWVSI